jgi:hypothetical protein
MQSFRINWVGNVDTHQRKLFWGLIEMLCERLTVPLLIMMGVHNTIRTAQRSYQASARVLLSAAGRAVATASFAGALILQQWTILATGWGRLPSAAPAMSKAAASCTSMAAGLATSESVRLLADTARSLAGLSAAAAAAAVNAGRMSLLRLHLRRQQHAAAAASAAARIAASRHASKGSSRRTRPAGTAAAAAAAAATPQAPLDAVAAERRRRLLSGGGRVRVRGPAVLGAAAAADTGSGALSGCTGAARRAWEAVRSTDVFLAL